MVSRCSTQFFKKMMTPWPSGTHAAISILELFQSNTFKMCSPPLGLIEKYILKKRSFEFLVFSVSLVGTFISSFTEEKQHSWFLMASFRIFWSGTMYQWWRTKCKQALRYRSCSFWHGWDFYEDRLIIFASHHHSSTPFLQIFCIFCFFSLDSQSEAPILKSRDGKSRKSESLIIAMLTDQGGIGGQITCTSGY